MEPIPRRTTFVGITLTFLMLHCAAVFVQSGCDGKSASHTSQEDASNTVESVGAETSSDAIETRGAPAGDDVIATPEATAAAAPRPKPPEIHAGSDWSKNISPWLKTSPWWQSTPENPSPRVGGENGPFYVAHSRAAPRLPTPARLVLWWEKAPEALKRLASRPYSNIHPQDYVGPEACGECHAEQYESWSQHPHRWMNTEATTDTIKGDFSGEASISYLGGKATFYKTAEDYRMRLERGDVRRVYRISQTIGSRFFQYYVGVQIEGPPASTNPIDRVDHVLPFGYWLDEKEWVPVVHIDEELPDGKRADPYDGADHDDAFFPYYTCNHCHTTFPLGDMFIRHPRLLGRHTPMALHWYASRYLEQARPEVLAARAVSDFKDADVGRMFANIEQMDARRYASTLGVSCEACHLGGRAHAEEKLEKPLFVPVSPNLLLESFGRRLSGGRTHANVNWVCGRCHSGNRPQYANGMSTWNSTEYSDAMLGACYSQLQCVDCHDPHTATGAKWSRSPDEDDELCLKCHSDTLGTPAARQAHTHHAGGSSGSRCMNCHMPRLNEGLQDLVRTHTIYSPTERSMIESNEPNACNMCHTDKSINWTLGYLADWYGASYAENLLAAKYPRRDEPAALGWLASDHEHVRLVAADVLARTDARWALPLLIGALDDKFLINRQFVARGLEKMLGIKLADHGYRFYMTPDERGGPIKRLLQMLTSKSP